MRYLSFILVLLLTACGGQPESDNSQTSESTEQVQHLIHSFAIPSEAVVKHLSWDADIDFDAKKIKATATYTFEASEGAKRIVFDVHGLEIEKVVVDTTETKDWWLGDPQPWLGQALEIAIIEQNKTVSITYSTSQDAEALQWLNAQQTADKEQPFLFTQSQAILARTWIPCQDSPGVRYTYDATVKVPSGLMALMSASNPTEMDSSGVYSFEMNQPIPSYLMALSVGDLRFAEIGDRTGVYAEPSVLDAAAYEFEDMQKMLEAAEALYGKYAWDRYDVIVLPPSFPFGGMENPRLTFATPTILAGDKSLTSLVAHELAHSWSGNLVTNSTWDDFWMNEGFTVYFENRIMESVYGKDYANMLAILGWQDLQHELENLSEQPDDTKLKLDLEGRNPDDGMTSIAYEKGYYFLRTLEENVGREKFDAFLNAHFTNNAFKTITTEDFLAHLKAELFDGNEQMYTDLKIDQWVYQPGVPDNVIKVESPLFDQVEAELDEWLNEGKAEEINNEGWTTHQWLHFLRNAPRDLSLEQMSELDEAFAFTQTGNSEIAAEWFLLTIGVNYTPADEAIEAFLIRVGRRKFLVPLYQALVQADPSMERARAIYEKARLNYHSVSTNTLDDLLEL